MLGSGFLSINAIYLATEGEGVNLGRPQIFVRTQGCHHHCANCDSKETWSFIGGERLSIEEVADRVAKFSGGKIRYVSITGGDPLAAEHAPSVLTLIRLLKRDGYKVNIEVAGDRIDNAIFDLVDFISCDYKTPSTKVRTDINVIKDLVVHFQGHFQIKSVVSDRTDFDYVLKAYRELVNVFSGLNDFRWCLTPSYQKGEPFPRERFLNVVKWNEEEGGPFLVIGQQHKWLHGPDATHV